MPQNAFRKFPPLSAYFRRCPQNSARNSAHFFCFFWLFPWISPNVLNFPVQWLDQTCKQENSTGFAMMTHQVPTINSNWSSTWWIIWFDPTPRLETDLQSDTVGSSTRPLYVEWEIDIRKLKGSFQKIPFGGMRGRNSGGIFTCLLLRRYATTWCSSASCHSFTGIWANNSWRGTFGLASSGEHLWNPKRKNTNYDPSLMFNFCREGPKTKR